jgi:membrane-bound lytic murein transglycosylase B
VTTGFLRIALVLLATWGLAAQASEQKQHRPKSPNGKQANRLIPATGPAYADRPEAMALADQIAEQFQLERKWVRRAIGHARFMPEVVRQAEPPPVDVPKNWQLYRNNAVDPVRVQAGVKFWKKNSATLARAEARYGVPAEIVVGILGVETLYGQQMGNYRAMDALATLAFDFPASHPRAQARSAFFKSELGMLLSLKRFPGIDPLTVRGSYAGALGMPQFMPSSMVRFSVDFDGDGRIDLYNSPADIIGSVAYYFKSFNWQPGMATHYPVRFDPEMIEMDALLAPDIVPTFSVDTFTYKGALLEGAARQHKGPLALVKLENGNGQPSYVAGTENFYVITRYNWSSYYALGVIELGQAVAAAMKPLALSAK